YQDSIVLMTEFVNLRIILLMKETPSRFFLYSLEELAYDIYKNYGEAIDNFDGDVHPFSGIENLIKKQLNASFVYPIRLASVEKIAKMRISQHERLFIDKAVSLMKMTNQYSFLIKSILPGKECNPKDVEALLDLINKGIFQLE
ncbi:MAG: hypothetical protein ACFFCI_21525, partial [Promethearchaeota archaeon]